MVLLINDGASRISTIFIEIQKIIKCLIKLTTTLSKMFLDIKNKTIIKAKETISKKIAGTKPK